MSDDLREELLLASLKSPKKDSNSKRSLEVIRAVLEGADLKTALKGKTLASHPHAYPWPFAYSPKLPDDFRYEEVGVVFGYVTGEPSNLEVLSYTDGIAEGVTDIASRWRVVHELAHKEVSVPNNLNPKSLVIWEWEVLKAQREIEKNLGLDVSEELVAKDSNSVMQDVVCRALTGRIPKAHEFGFIPFDSLAPLDYALSVVEEFA